MNKKLPTHTPSDETIHKITGQAAELLSRKTGLLILSLAVCFVAAWLFFQGRSTLEPSHTTGVPPLHTSESLARFRADSFYLPDNTLLGFVEIPHGGFLMGSDPSVDNQAFENERWSQEHKQGWLELSTFYMSKYEVTVAQFRGFIEATHYKNEASLGDIADQPITNVSWTDAIAYARWLDSALRLATIPPQLKQLLESGWHVDMPTEAQWEKAARGSDGRIFPWGNLPDRRFSNYENASVQSVGALECDACAYHLADMSGNVWELTRSPYRPYPFDANATFDAKSDALLVMRGGSFNDAPGNIRSAIRGAVDPGARRPFIGFRVALSHK